MPSISTLVSGLYGMSGAAVILSYAPQVLSAWKSQHGASDISLKTWGLWCLTSLITLAYAAIVVKNTGFVLMSAGNLAGTLAVTGAVAWCRLETRKAMSQGR
jgi:hypothetical protein